jgi:hypothetical protein
MQPTYETLYNAFFITLYIIILLLILVGILNAFISWKRKRYIKDAQYNLTFLQIKLPAQNEIEVEAAEHLFSNLMGTRRSFWENLLKGPQRISFEIVSKSDGIGFYIVVPDELVSFIEKQVNGAYPTAEIDIVDPKEIWDRGTFTEIAELKLAGPAYFPINSYKDTEKSDSLSTITSSLSKLKESEVVAIQYLISPASNSWRTAGSTFINKMKRPGSNPEKPSAPIDNSIIESIEKKVGKPGFDVALRIVSIAEDQINAKTHIKNVISSFEQFTNVKYNRFKTRRVISRKKLVDQFIYRKMKIINVQIPIFDISIYRNVSVLNIEEMATIFHFPNKNVQTPNIIWLSARKASAPSNIPAEGLYLGKNIFRNVERKIYMKPEDRKRHMYIIGQTGTGKSQYMQSLALQDIRNGEGVAFIDPHGSDLEELLTKIPEERIDDVILFDVSDTERPIGLNLLEADNEEQRHMLINAFIAMLYKLYDPNNQGIMGPQLERAIRNVMLTAMEDPESTMVDVLRLLIDEEYVKKFIPLIKDPLVKRYWTDEMAKTTANRKGEMMGYFVSKFDRLVTEKTMRNIFGQPKSAINFNKIMAEKKILLANLSKGKIGEENSNFLGLMLVPRILTAALGRANLVGKEEFPNFYLYVDEFQNFATPDFATILSEARKYKLNLTVAHQFIAQLDDTIKQAVFGNVGTMTAFRVGADDAEYLESQFEPIFEQTDLINNPIGNCYLRLLIDGHPSVPFSLAVDWDAITHTQKNPEVAQRIKENSRMKYGTPVKEVEEFINMRSGVTDETEIDETINELPKLNPKKLIPF